MDFFTEVFKELDAAIAQYKQEFEELKSNNYLTISFIDDEFECKN